MWTLRRWTRFLNELYRCLLRIARQALLRNCILLRQRTRSIWRLGACWDVFAERAHTSGLTYRRAEARRCEAALTSITCPEWYFTMTTAGRIS